MPATALRRPDAVELAWGGLAVASLGAMVVWPSWETIPFHVIWISLTLLYGFRVWSPTVTGGILGIVVAGTGASILADAFAGLQLWGELFEVPLMSAMFLAMVWHARRRMQMHRTLQTLADERASLLEQEERLLHNVSHELRTPVTIVRGHLEVLERRLGGLPELATAFDELQHMQTIIDRILLLARADRRDWIEPRPVALVGFLEDLFVRWAEVAPRGWRLGAVPDIVVSVDETWLRAAIDALVENAVQHTDVGGRIELAARTDLDTVVISVGDDGAGIPPAAIGQIFERFARADESRSRDDGGAGLGLAIVAAIARTHDGSCSAANRPEGGAVFELRLPLPRDAQPEREPAPELVVAPA